MKNKLISSPESNIDAESLNMMIQLLDDKINNLTEIVNSSKKNKESNVTI